jgi:hypothetical protein
MHNPDNKTDLSWAFWAGLAGFLLVWFGAASAIGTERLLVNETQTFLAPIAVSAVIPIVAFVLLYALSPRLRRVVLALDIRTLTMLHLWRVVGFAFLPLVFFDVLPGFFGWPAGWGDVAIGLAAPFVAAGIGRDVDAAASVGLVRFHLLGLLDLVVAMLTAGLAAGEFPILIANGVTSAPMDLWPLNLFPSFIVPVFVILHLCVLLKLRHLRRAARQPLRASAGAA